MDGVVVKRFYGGGGGGGGGSDDRCFLTVLSLDDLSHKVSENLNLPSFIYDEFIICGSCCGLLYLDDSEGNIVLCNLTTRELKLLPPPKFQPLPNSVEFYASGIGYDSKSDDLKVINFFRQPYYRKIGSGTKMFRGYKKHCELYSLKSGVWKSIPTPDANISGGSGVYVGGRCYWTAFLGSSFGGPSCSDKDDILSFDFSMESFHCLHSPPSSEDLELVFNLVEHRGSLGAIGFNPFADSKRFEFWVWEESSWTKVFDVVLSNVEGPLGLKDGRLLFLERKSCDELNQLLVYDWITKEWKELDIYDYYDQLMVTFHVEAQVTLPDARLMQRSYTHEEEEELSKGRRKKSCDDEYWCEDKEDIDGDDVQWEDAEDNDDEDSCEDEEDDDGDDVMLDVAADDDDDDDDEDS